MKPKVYIETSIPSYLTAWRSRDIVIAGNQETTKELWGRRDDFELFISIFVLEEVSVLYACTICFSRIPSSIKRLKLSMSSLFAQFSEY